MSFVTGALYSRGLDYWPPKRKIYALENENNGILAECAKVFKLGYCPDFFFLGCVKDGTEEVEVKLEKGKARLKVVKLVPQDAFIFEVKSSDPTKKGAYTKNS